MNNLNYKDYTGLLSFKYCEVRSSKDRSHMPYPYLLVSFDTGRSDMMKLETWDEFKEIPYSRIFYLILN